MNASSIEEPPVVIDITRLLGRALKGRRPTGVDRVGLAYVGHFAYGDLQLRTQALVRFAGRWVVLSRKDSQRLFDWLMAPQASAASPTSTILWSTKRQRSRSASKAFHVKQGGQVRGWIAQAYAMNWRPPPAGSVLLNVVHSGLDLPDYARRVLRLGLRPVYFLHDLIPIEFPEYGRPQEAHRHRRRVQNMLATACGVIVNSSVTGQALAAYASHLGMPIPPQIVAHLGVPVLPQPAHERPMPEPYFVVVGTIEPRKNHLLLLHLWRRLVSERGANAPRLVLIGQRGWECEQVVDILERCEALKGFVIELSDCDDAALATWLRHAQALLFPSFVEGYGIPLVEALSLGTPVIASELPVFRELAGDIPEYLNPLDGLGWYGAIIDYAAPPSPRREAQLARMAHWQAPTWEAHFQKVEAFLARCLG